MQRQYLKLDGNFLISVVEETSNGFQGVTMTANPKSKAAS